MWNQRRVIIQKLLDAIKSSLASEGENNGDDIDNKSQDLISNDLSFLIPLLRKFPKCYWIWNYRLWLLQQANRYLRATSALALWQYELQLDSKMLAQDSRNFHAWGYRRTVVAAIEAIQITQSRTPTTTTTMQDFVSATTDTKIATVKSPDISSITQQEFDFSTKMINANLSNFSAWHHRSKVLPRLLDEKHADDKGRKQALDDELVLVERALYTADNDQSPWFYHQYLVSTFRPRYSAESMTPNLSNEQRLQYVREEIEKIMDMLEGAEDNKWIYETLIQLVLLYRELSGQWPEQVDSVRAWIEQLQALDPLRSGRWHDLIRQFDKQV